MLSVIGPHVTDPWQFLMLFRLELALNLGPLMLRNSSFIRSPAGRRWRVGNESLSAFYCPLSYAGAHNYTFYAKPCISASLLRGS